MTLVVQETTVEKQICWKIFRAFKSEQDLRRSDAEIFFISLQKIPRDV